ncbi:VOC family protein [Paenibacillus algorifonticola]|uniref:VOC family protein n=1 Tax=Paenibacillus algorifonticola TaxID=684063 RepID=UPI003D2A88FA
MAVQAYLNFNGNCREAVLFYAEVFGTDKPEIMTFGDSPPNPEYEMPEAVKPLVMHTRLKIMGSTIMFSDVFPDMPFVEGTNISLSVVSKDLEELQSVFNKLKEGGTVEMELAETFWSKGYGSLKDKFGIHWQINQSDEEF